MGKKKVEKDKYACYERLRKYSPEQVLPRIGLDEEDFDGEMIKMWSLRYQVFKKDRCTCKKCGMKGTFFWMERNKYNEGKCYHFNLYGIDSEGKEVLFTKDHIIPVSKGGRNDLSNLQTMCQKCNEEKGNKVE